MKPLIRDVLIFLLAATVAAATAFAWGGQTAALATLCIMLAAWKLLDAFYTVRLLKRLGRAEDSPMPQGTGIWQPVFRRLSVYENSRNKHKQQLIKTLRRLNRIAEAAPNGAVLLNAEGRIQWLNTPAARHLGLNDGSRGSLLVRHINDPELNRLLQQKKHKHPPALRLTLADNGRLPRTISLTCTALGDRSRLLVTQDITAEEQADTTRTAFVANVSHELRTPLTVINGFLETFAEMPDLPRDQQQHFVALMLKEGQRMSDLLTDLLTLTRLEDKTKDTKFAAVDLSHLTAQIARDAATLSDGRHQIDTDIAENIRIEGLPKDLYSALSNIAFNAVRYTPDGSKIAISLTDNGDTARLSVRDNGPGIAPEHLPHLTERFYRVDEGRSRQSGGTGLGLAITKHALLQHGTDLDIRSEVGKGSEFSVVFRKK